MTLVCRDVACTVEACTAAQADLLGMAQAHGAESTARIVGLNATVDSASAELCDLGDELDAFSEKSQEVGP